MSKKSLNFQFKLSVSALALVSMGFADVAVAQAADEDEIIVTARRQSESLIEVPGAVSAFSEENIENLGFQSIDDIARHTAGFSFSNAFGRTTERPVIRGAANILAGVQFGVEAGAAYFIDGVYYSGDLQAIDIRNVERVEVIKGPQSALYGRNTYSGAINFVTRRPSQAGFEGNIEGIAAEDGEFQLYGRVGDSFLDDKVGVSLSARYYTYGGDGAWKNGVDGSQLGEEESLNLNATFDIRSGNASLVARAGYTEDKDGPRPFALIGAEQNNCFPGYRSGAYYDPNYLSFLDPPFGGIFPETVTTDSNYQYFCGNLSQFEDLAPTQNLDATPFVGVEREMIFGSALFEYEFDDGHALQVSVGARDQELLTGSDSDHQVGTINFIPISPFFSIPTADGFLNTSGVSEESDVSVELRVSSDPQDSFRYSAGLYHYEFEDEGFGSSLGRVSADDSLGLERDTTNEIDNSAVFGTLEFDVTDELTLGAEARYQEETKGRKEFSANIPDYNEEKKFTDFVYKGLFSYDFSEDMSLYGSYAHGVKPGGVNGSSGLSANAEFYEPEEVDAFEVGLKGYLANAFRFSLSGYFNDVSQYQLTTPVAEVGSGNVNSVATNQGNAEIKGVEFEGSYSLSDQLKIGATYAWTDAEFKSGCDDFQFTLNSGGFLIAPFDRTNPPTTGLIRDASGVTPGFLTPPTDADGLFTGNLSCDITGNKVPLTSEHQASVYGQFEMPISDTMDGFINLDLTHESSKFVQVHNQMETGAANILSGQVGVKFEDVRVELFGRNLLDERTPPAATRWFDLLEGFPTTPSSTGGYIDRTVVGPRSTFLSYRRGRQLGVRASMDF